MNVEVQVIRKNGHPEWAILPYEEYERLLEADEMLQDIQAYDEGIRQLELGVEELLPQSFLDRILNDENLVRIWREYRQLTQAQLADLARITPAYLSQLETGKRTGGTEVLSRIARALNISVDDLL